MKNKLATIQAVAASAPVIKPAAELDVDVMKKLYDFGGLLAYHIMYLDTVTFTLKQWGEMTFNEERAKSICDGLVRNGFKVELFRQMVHFDGKWAKGVKHENEKA